MEFEGIKISKYIEKNENFHENFEKEAEFDYQLIEKLKKSAHQFKFVVISEEWCKDCKRDVPKLAKIAKKAELDMNVYEGSKEVRTFFNINRIPTTIVFDNDNNELGRIIEKMKYKSLEEDLNRIIKKDY